MKHLVFAAVLAALAPACAQQAPAPEISGLWSARLDFSPQTAGALAVSKTADGWRATIAGEARTAPDIAFVFADGSRFDGAVSDSGAIDGWWTQPLGLGGQAYASRLQLKADGDLWRGDAAPLPQAFDLYLKIFTDETGAARAAFRNPQYNMNGGASQFAVALNGDALSFTARDGALKQTATYRREDDTIRFDWPYIPRPIIAARASAGEAAAFFPRAPGAYHYARPPETGDGWKTARGRDAGLDEAALAALIEGVIATDPASARPQLLHSLLVARHGKLVLEEYFYGHDRETPHDTRSTGKTFASVLLGALMREGAAIGPQTRLVDILATEDDDPRKREITVAHLLTHTSGLDCNDNDDSSPGNEGAMQDQRDQPDWVRYALDLPMAHAPGARYAYCSAGINLAGGALSAAAGEPIPDLFDRLIAQPLQFGRYYWNLAPDGAGYLGGGAHILPRDLLKLGQAYLSGGVWNGRRLVNESWVAQSTKPHVAINEETTGMDAETFAQNAIRGADGLAWHRYPVRAGERVIEAYEANGNGGQYLIVVPDYDLVVVMTGGNYGQGGIWLRWRDAIVGEKIIGAISD